MRKQREHHPGESGTGDLRITAARGAYDTCHLDGAQTLKAGDYVLQDDAVPTLAEPLPIALVAEAATPGNAYTLVLADDFGSGYQSARWGDAYNGSTEWNGAFDWSVDDVAIRDEVTSTRHEDGSWTSGSSSGVTAGQTITYGIVEFDARVEQAQGTQAAILMCRSRLPGRGTAR